jgi:putative transposase
VRHDGTISVNARLYEVSARFIGRQVEVRFDNDTVYIYEEGVQVEQAKLVNFQDNAHVKRDKTLAMRNMKEGGQDV